MIEELILVGDVVEVNNGGTWDGTQFTVASIQGKCIRGPLVRIAPTANTDKKVGNTTMFYRESVKRVDQPIKVGDHVEVIRSGSYLGIQLRITKIWKRTDGSKNTADGDVTSHNSAISFGNSLCFYIKDLKVIRPTKQANVRKARRIFNEKGWGPA